MTFIVHLSDLHMTRSDRAQSRLFDNLLCAPSAEHDKTRPERTTVFITGNVFDSGTDPPGPLVKTFLDWHTFSRSRVPPISRRVANAPPASNCAPGCGP
jgi:hypothetical protein